MFEGMATTGGGTHLSKDDGAAEIDLLADIGKQLASKIMSIAIQNKLDCLIVFFMANWGKQHYRIHSHRSPTIGEK